MAKWANGILSVLVACGVLGCASKAPKEPTLAEGLREEAVHKQFESGLKYLEQENYPQARKIFERILTEHPASEFDLVVLFNLGAALEGQKDCLGASERYKQVARVALNKYKRLEANALLRLSYTYECLSQDDKVIVSLLDVRRRARLLPDDTVKAEVPARLAGAYARQGNRAEAEKYFLEALKGIKFLQVKYKDSHQLADTMAQALYFMGRGHVEENAWLRNPVANIKGLAYTQLYLLQAAELGSPKWSGRAVSEVLDSYERVWKVINQLPVEPSKDSQIEERQRRQKQVAVLKETLRALRMLRAQRLPTRQENGDMRRLFTGVEDQEKKVTAYLSETATDINLTPEAESREGLKREGRTKAPAKSPLEKNPSAKLPVKASKK